MEGTQQATQSTVKIEDTEHETKDQETGVNTHDNTTNKNENTELSKATSDEATQIDDDPEYNTPPASSVFGVPKRYILAILIFCGFMNMYAIRVNLNVAIGAMVKNHTVYQNGKHVAKVCSEDSNL